MEDMDEILKMIETKRLKRAKQAQKKSNVEMQIELYRNSIETLESDIAVRDDELEALGEIVAEAQKIKNESSEVDQKINEFLSTFEYNGTSFSEDEHYLELKKESQRYEDEIAKLVTEFKRKYYGK